MPSDTDVVGADCVIYHALPRWTHPLIQLGYEFARARKIDPEGRLTMGICIPRLEFAALIISLGALKWKSSEVVPKTGLDRLRSMHKAWVSFQVGGETNVGILDTLPDSETGEVKILNFQGRKLPVFEDMTFEERLNFVPPVSGGCWYVLEPQDWPSIRPMGREFNEERGARKDQVRRIAADARLSVQAEQLIGPGAASWLVSSKESPIHIFGNKTRLEDELEEEIRLGEHLGAFNFAELLRPAGFNVVYPRTNVQPFSKIASSETPLLCLIEGGRNLGDHLRASAGSDRIVLLAQNESAYESAVQVLKNAFHGRAGDWSWDGIVLPSYIKILSFRHK